MQASLNRTAVAQYRPLQSLESKLFLRKLLDVKDSMEYRGHLSVYAPLITPLVWTNTYGGLHVSFQMSVIFRLAYGRRVRTLQDDIVLRSMKAGVSKCGLGSSYERPDASLTCTDFEK